MQRKFLLACGALVAFVAFAVMPALASAAVSPTLTENGVSVVVGSSVTGTLDPGTQSVLTVEGGGSITCSAAHFSGVVTTNSGNVVAGNIETATFTGTGTGGACTSTGLLGTQWTVTTSVPWCLETKTVGTATITNGKCGKTSGGLKFLLKSGFTECEYEKAEVGGNKDTTGSYSLNVSPATLDVTNNTFNVIRSNSGTLCKNGTLDAKFILETPDGTSLTIS